ncbi:hypothetical protein AVEN_111417-1 [Araneus ventricosus]|uniref:Uncharacterized protein n=1 Tax=Araneus ventricosus TaxID=182803 RepID=A0A4Y2K2P4_ARAVE|nr:hypothetical protein AVEN_111417-1 [Araneus ventricosus]
MLRIFTWYTLDLINPHAKESLSGLSKNVGSRFDPPIFLCMGIYKIQGVPGETRNIEQFKQRITASIKEITPAILRHVFWATVERWELCRDVQGGHIEMYKKCVSV